MTINDINEFVACVNGGSGVLFQPADPTCTYLLTAKHVLEDIDSATYEARLHVRYFNKATNTFVAITPFALHEGVNYFPHAEAAVDISIVKIPRLQIPTCIITAEDLFAQRKDYILKGYPAKRRKADLSQMDLSWQRTDDKIDLLQDTTGKKVEADVLKNQNLEELRGTSGGGLFRLCGDLLILAGIQNKIPEADENLGRIEFTPTTVFNEIIREYPGHLEEFIPAYLKSFSFLKDESFQISGGLKSARTVAEISGVLRNHTQQIINSDFTPNCIRDFLGSAVLLMHGQDNSSVYYKPLWTAWLELLTILVIAREKVFQKADFEELLSSIRLFYSPTDKDFWVAHLKDLANSNYKGLNKNGLVVVCSRNPARDNKHILEPRDIPEDITRAYKIEALVNEGSLSIDNGRDFPFQKYKFVNISVFKENTVLDQYEQFENMPVEDIVPKLKSLYEQLIQL